MNKGRFFFLNNNGITPCSGIGHIREWQVYIKNNIHPTVQWGFSLEMVPLCSLAYGVRTYKYSKILKFRTDVSFYSNFGFYNSKVISKYLSRFILLNINRLAVVTKMCCVPIWKVEFTITCAVRWFQCEVWAFWVPHPPSPNISISKNNIDISYRGIWYCNIPVYR